MAGGSELDPDRRRDREPNAAEMAGIQDTVDFCGGVGGGGHIGSLLCSGIIQDLIAECRHQPTLGLCGRLARRVIEKCQDQTTGLCPGSLKHISQNCFHGLRPVERANLTEIVLCVYKSLDPSESEDNMSMWISAVVFVLVFLAALAVLIQRFEEVKSFATTTKTTISAAAAAAAAATTTTTNQSLSTSTTRETVQQTSQQTSQQKTESVTTSSSSIETQNSVSRNQQIDQTDGATARLNGPVVGQENGHVTSQQTEVTVNDHVVSEVANEVQAQNPVHHGQNGHVPTGEHFYLGDRRIKTAILYPEYSEAAIEEVTNNFVQRFNQRSTSGRLMTCSFFHLADVPDDTLVLVPCLVPSRLGTNVRRVLRAHGVRKGPVRSKRVLLVLHHNQSMTSPASLKATSTVTGASESHLANAFRSVVDVVFYRCQIYDCAQNKRACDQLEEIVAEGF